MGSSTFDIDFQSIGKRCLEICQESHSIGLVVKMSMSIGSAFSFNFCSETNGSLPLPTVFDKSKKKPKSPSTKRRDLVRLAAFRIKKATSPGVPLAPECSPLDLPIVTPSQKEFHVPSTSTSFDRRSPVQRVAEFHNVLYLAWFKGGLCFPLIASQFQVSYLHKLLGFQNYLKCA